MLQLSPSPFLPSHTYKGKLTTSLATKCNVNHGYPMVTAPINTCLNKGILCCVATVGTPR